MMARPEQIDADDLTGRTCTDATFAPVSEVAVRVCRQTARRRQLLEHLRHVQGVRTMSELLAETGRRDVVLMRADLNVLEADGLVWRRDMTWSPNGDPITETCWWAPLVRFAAKHGGMK